MKNCVILVPHEDDEINLCGNVLSKIVKKFNTYVIFSSIDVNPKMAAVRKQEAINSCHIFGIPSKNVIFLGFPDTPNDKKPHFFLTEEGHNK